MKRRLFASERELHSWRSLTLTSHRVIHLDVRHGLACSTSIPLAHVQWTRIARSHRPALLSAAGLLGLLSMLALESGDTRLALLLLVVGAVLALAYLGSRHATLRLASGGGHIELPVGASEQARLQARDFLDAVEAAAGHATMRPAMLSGFPVA